METVCLYIAYLDERLSYVSIINYVSAVWVLHDINQYNHVDPKSFEITFLLQGIRRLKGDTSKKARPFTVEELNLMSSCLDFSDTEGPLHKSMS